MKTDDAIMTKASIENIVATKAAWRPSAGNDQAAARQSNGEERNDHQWRHAENLWRRKNSSDRKRGENITKAAKRRQRKPKIFNHNINIESGKRT